jgi:hypothetical protein
MITVGSTVTVHQHSCRQVTPLLAAWIEASQGQEFYVIDRTAEYVRLGHVPFWLSIDLLIEKTRFPVKTYKVLKTKEQVQPLW